MKESITTILIGILLIISIPVIIFAGYLLIGFFDWIYNDPLDIISEPKEYISPYQADINNCRENGGHPILSFWDGRLKECQYNK